MSYHMGRSYSLPSQRVLYEYWEEQEMNILQPPTEIRTVSEWQVKETRGCPNIVTFQNPDDTPKRKSPTYLPLMQICVWEYAPHSTIFAVTIKVLAAPIWGCGVAQTRSTYITPYLPMRYGRLWNIYRAFYIRCYCARSEHIWSKYKEAFVRTTNRVAHAKMALVTLMGELLKDDEGDIS